jgi:hypothetical protein
LNHPEQQQQQQHQQALLQQKQQSQQQQRGHAHQQEVFVTPVTTCTSGDFRTTGHVGAGDSPSIWENQSSDPVLSELLDQVIDFVPESIITGKSLLCLIHAWKIN